MPQLFLKVPVFRRWGKRFFVVVDSHFFADLPTFKQAGSASNSELTWLTYSFDKAGVDYRMHGPRLCQNSASTLGVSKIHPPRRVRSGPHGRIFAQHHRRSKKVLSIFAEGEFSHSLGPKRTLVPASQRRYPCHMTLRKPTPGIQVDGDAFMLVGVAPELPPITLDDIEDVTFFKRDEWATDLICCEIAVSAEKGGQTWFLHEEVPGWSDLIALMERLPGFDPHWWGKVAHPAFAENRTVAFRKPH